jgi:tryptophanyl-tRNA synthetase
MSLKDGTKKMSKSDVSDLSRINVGEDQAEKILSKIKKAKTDSSLGISYDPTNRPEIANLLHIYSAISNTPIANLCKEFEHITHALFKEKLAQVLIEKLEPIRQEYLRLGKEKNYVLQVLSEGARQANEIAHQNMTVFKQKLGID